MGFITPADMGGVEVVDVSRKWAKHEQTIAGWICALPWILGFLIFTLGPMITSLFLSFHDYNVLQPPYYVGLENYTRMFDGGPESVLFWKSLYNTFYMTVIGVPLTLLVALLSALLLNMPVKGQALFRTCFYVPSIVPLVANSLLWMWLLNSRYGIMNTVLRGLGLTGPAWLASPVWSKPAMILMSAWQSGSPMLIFLAGLQGIPNELYEAAEVDGASGLKQFQCITLPLLTPTIFFNVIMGIIGTMQIFVRGYIMTNGGPADSTLFYVLNLYFNAFRYFRMGYASALAWVLFIIVLLITLVQIRMSGRWVHYEL